jgi:RimJ/RimL family protein N-acetyltransferase
VAFRPIRTERLLLRPVRPDDVDPLVARRNEEAVARYQNWELPYPVDRAERLIAETAAMPGPVDGEWWMLTVADPADRLVHGDLVVLLTWRGRTAEIGYSFAPDAWGRGYAAEATGALIRHLFEDLGVTRIEASLHPDNRGSAMVLERCGLLFEGHTRASFWLDGECSDDWLYGMVRDDHDRWASRPRHRPSAVSLVEIDHRNVDAVLALATHRSQQAFVAPVARALAEALVPPHRDGAPLQPWCRAVVADDELVGFVMLALSNDAHPETWLWRLLVDREHQRRGIGSAVLDLVVEFADRRGDHSLLTSWVPGKGSPEPLYLGADFVPTGDRDGGEIVARLAIG